MSPSKPYWVPKAKTIRCHQVNSTRVQEADQFMKKRVMLLKSLWDHLVEAKERMKLITDQRWTEREFQEGDLVYLQLQPYRQSSLSSRRNLKLAPRFYGPYKVLKRIGKVAYKLLLPEQSKINPIFHVSQLKLKVGNKEVTSQTLPPVGA